MDFVPKFLSDSSSNFGKNDDIFQCPRICAISESVDNGSLICSDIGTDMLIKIYITRGLKLVFL